MINYYLLTKPGILFGNLLTFIAGFALGGRGAIDSGLLLAAMLGLALIMASGCVCNNYIDRETDRMMSRTKQRPLVQGKISGKAALVFAGILFLLGATFLIVFVNWLSLVVASFGFFVYVFLYSMWKGRTIYGTAIGSIAGAVPPVVGYCAASNQLDLPSIILFFILVFWQMPHFFAIALVHLEDYAKAGIPVLPVVEGTRRTKWHIVGYIACFIPVAMLLTLMGYTGILFLLTALLLGCGWLLLGLTGLWSTDDKKFGKQMFIFSLIVMGAISVVMPFDIML